MGWVWGVSYRDHWFRADRSPRQPPSLIRQQRQDAFGLRQDMLALLEHAVLISAFGAAIPFWVAHDVKGECQSGREGFSRCWLFSRASGSRISCSLFSCLADRRDTVRGIPRLMTLCMILEGPAAVDMIDDVCEVSRTTV